MFPLLQKVVSSKDFISSLDGYVNESFSEDVQARFRAQGWDTFEIDGHNLDQISQVFSPHREIQNKPIIIIANTKIGCGSPTKEGTPAAHGRPLGAVEIEKAKKALSLSLEPFYVDPTIYSFLHKQSQEHCEVPYALAKLNYQSIIEPIICSSPIASHWASHEILNTYLNIYLKWLWGRQTFLLQMA